MSIFKILFSELDESSNDKLGAYPEKVHVSAMPERRYLKTSRIMTLVATAFLCGAMALGFVVHLLSPLLRSQPLLLKIDKRFYQLDVVQTAAIGVSASLLLTEEHIKQYILLRHTILGDLDEMNARWDEQNSHLYWYSSSTAFQQFIVEKNINMARMAEGLTTEIKVRFVERVSSGIWLAEFDSIERMPEDEYPTVKRWRVVIEAGFRRRAYPNRDEQIKNPFNFYVTNYHLVSRALTKDNKDAKFID